MRSGVWVEGGSERADRECDQVGDDQTRGQQGGRAEAQAAVSSWLEPRMAEGGLQVRGCRVSGALEDRDAEGHRPAGGGPCLHSRAGCLLDASEAVSVLTSVGSWGHLAGTSEHPSPGEPVGSAGSSFLTAAQCHLGASAGPTHHRLPWWMQDKA